MKILLSIALSVTLLTAAKPSHDNDLAILKEEKEGFYYYSETNESKKTETKVPLNPQQKLQAKQIQELIRQMKINNALQTEILKRLKYAFPRTIPEYSVSSKTGKRCKTNMTADCFVPPVTAEAQNSIPAFAEMIRNPTAQNVKNAMEVQAMFLNNAFKVGYGFNLVGMQYERDVHKVDGTGFTQLPGHNNLQNSAQRVSVSAMLKAHENKIGYLVFFDGRSMTEHHFEGQEYIGFFNSTIGNLKNVRIIFKNQRGLDLVNGQLERYKEYQGTKNFYKRPIEVNPDLFTKLKINATPAIVLLYKTDQGKLLYQKLGYGQISGQNVLDRTYRFLKFNNIIKPGMINEKNAWDMSDSLLQNSSFSDEELKRVKFNDTNITATKDQYLE